MATKPAKSDDPNKCWKNGLYIGAGFIIGTILLKFYKAGFSFWAFKKYLTFDRIAAHFIILLFITLFSAMVCAVVDRIKKKIALRRENQSGA